MNDIKEEIKIYVYGHLDKTVSANTGVFGIIITNNDEKIKEYRKVVSETSKDRIELTGIIDGLEFVKEMQNIAVCLPQGYIVDAVEKGWLQKWKKEKFLNRKNADLWKKLDEVLSSYSTTVKFLHSRSDNSTDFSNEARQLAKKKPKTNAVKVKSSVNSNRHVKRKKIKLSEFDSNIIDYDSLCVDASCVNNVGPTEYRAVDTKTKEVIFEKRYLQGTNNIGEFLAIVHALTQFKGEGKELNVLYSDSYTALIWVKSKECNTTLKRSDANKTLFDDIDRAVNWLKTNEYDTKLLKWKTKEWGEIPADYGRK